MIAGIDIDISNMGPKLCKILDKFSNCMKLSRRIRSLADMYMYMYNIYIYIYIYIYII